MFNKTKKRYESIKNFGKETVNDMKKLKEIQNLDGSAIKIIALLLITGLGIGYLASLLPIWLYTIFALAVTVLYFTAKKYE